MGAAASLLTLRVDLRNRTLNYETLQQHMQMIGPYTLSRVKILYLCRNKISSLPPELTSMMSLVELHCTDNWLKSLPQDIRSFTQLQQLRVGGNQLLNIEPILPNAKDPEKWRQFEDDPDSFNRLHILRCGHNKIQHLPSKLHFLKLRVLVANNNDLAALPLDFFELSTLEVLVLSKNRLTTLPPIESLTISLKVLVMNKNRMKALPPTLTRAQRLMKLYASENQLETIPKGLAGLREITELDLSRNALTGDEVTRSGFLRSTSLKIMKFKPGNPLIPEATLRRDATQRSLPAVKTPTDLEDEAPLLEGEDPADPLLSRPGGPGSPGGGSMRQNSMRGGGGGGRGRGGAQGGRGGGGRGGGGRGGGRGGAQEGPAPKLKTQSSNADPRSGEADARCAGRISSGSELCAVTDTAWMERGSGEINIT